MVVGNLLTLTRKHLNGTSVTPAPTQAPAMNGAQAWRNGLVNPTDIVNPGDRRWSGSTTMSNDIGGNDFTTQHVPHSICKHCGIRAWDKLIDQTNP